jgi:hypothetical protein
MKSATTVMAQEGIPIIFVKDFYETVYIALTPHPSHPLNHSRMFFEYFRQLAG